MMDGTGIIDTWSIFGRAPLVVGIRTALEAFSLGRAMDAFVECGALAEQRDVSGFNCALPVRKFVGLGYSRRLSVPCVVEIRREATRHELNVAAVVDLEGIRRAKRFLFYFLSVFAFVLVIPQLMQEWDITAFIFLFAPWPIAEISFFVDRGRLQARLERILTSVRAVDPS